MRCQFSSTLLLIFWAGIEAPVLSMRRGALPRLSCDLQVGVNPYAVMSKTNASEKPYDKVLDTCIRAAYLE